MKVELKHLSAYLPYDLKFLNTNTNNRYDILGLYDDSVSLYSETQPTETLYFISGWDCLKPILRPLTDLYNTDGFSLSKMISHGYHNTFWSTEKFSVNHVYYHDLLILLEHHFDVFGLIDAGLAIDINTI
jgi:hypothetical protein